MSSDPSSSPNPLPASPEADGKSVPQDALAGSPVLSSSATSKEARPNGKKKTSRTLTPAQLAKKRANDREAQRAIRERTKHQIEALEKRIRELESDAPYRQTEAAIKEKEAVQRENDDLRRKLNSILEIIQGPASEQVSNDVCLPTRLPKRESVPLTVSQSIGHSSTLPSPSSLPSSARNSHDAYAPRAYAASRPTSVASSPVYVVSPMTPMESQPPAFSQVPKHIPPTCLHDKILADFISEIQQHVTNGGSAMEILGPPYPDFTSLLYPEKPDSKNPLSLSALLIDLLKAFSHVAATPEKVAVISILFDTMRWLIAPTPEHYGRLPEYLRPVHTQTQIAHPMWIDFLPWPRMRFKMVHNYPSLPLDEFFLPYTVSLSVNWPPGDDASSCLYHDPETDCIRMTPAFRSHVNNLDNWSVGPNFAEQIPLLADTCRIEKPARVVG